MTYINISGYQFTPLQELMPLQQALEAFCQERDLKGTVLLSHEGINCFIAGQRQAIDAFYQLMEQKGFTIDFKESHSSAPPFKRMWVKIKAEIIKMGVPDINPALNPAPYITAETFDEWLQKGKSMIILDTRNDYEVRIGKFKNAIDLNIKRFHEFPNACEQLTSLDKNTPIVTYCTGGVRCEKAAPLLREQGFKEVYQLEGGIIKYLERCGHAFYQGECFVFDKRIAVDGTLNESTSVQCHACRQPVTALEQQSADYQAGTFCPHCHENLHRNKEPLHGTQSG